MKITSIDRKLNTDQECVCVCVCLCVCVCVFNGANSYYNMSDDSQRTEPPLAPNFLDTPTLDKCPTKELEVTIINDTEKTLHKLNLQIQHKTTKLEAIKMFVKEQFYLIKKSLTEINNQSKPRRKKEFIELLKQQNKNLVEEKKKLP